MKRILTLTLALAAFSSLAQSPTVYTLGTLNGGTNTVLAAATNSPAAVIACSEYDNVGIQITLKATDTTTGVATFRFAETLDSSNYETVPQHVINVPMTSTTTVTYVTDLSIPNTAALKLTTIENTNATAIFTNVTVKARFKEPRRR